MLELINVAVERLEVSADVSVFTFVPFSDLAFQLGILLFQAAHPFQVVAQATVQELHGLFFIAVEDPLIKAERVAGQRTSRRWDAGWWDTSGT